MEKNRIDKNKQSDNKKFTSCGVSFASVVLAAGLVSYLGVPYKNSST